MRVIARTYLSSCWRSFIVFHFHLPENAQIVLQPVIACTPLSAFIKQCLSMFCFSCFQAVYNQYHWIACVLFWFSHLSPSSCSTFQGFDYDQTVASYRGGWRTHLSRAGAWKTTPVFASSWLHFNSGTGSHAVAFNRPALILVCHIHDPAAQSTFKCFSLPL